MNLEEKNKINIMIESKVTLYYYQINIKRIKFKWRYIVIYGNLNGETNSFSIPYTHLIKLKKSVPVWCVSSDVDFYDYSVIHIGESIETNIIDQYLIRKSNPCLKWKIL